MPATDCAARRYRARSMPRISWHVEAMRPASFSRVRAISVLPSGAPRGFCRPCSANQNRSWAAADQRRLVAVLQRRLDGGPDFLRVVAVHAITPAVGLETCGVSSVNQPSVLLSMEILLSSQNATSLPSPHAGQRRGLVRAPSIRQPSPMNTQVVVDDVEARGG